MNTFNQWLQHNHPEDIKENKALLAALALGTTVPSASQAAPPPKPKVMQMGSRLTDSPSPNVQAIGWHLMKKDGINASIKNKTLTGSHEGKPFSIQMENEQLSGLVKAVTELYQKIGKPFSTDDVQGFRGSASSDTRSHTFGSESGPGVRPQSFRGGSDAERTSLYRSQIGK